MQDPTKVVLLSFGVFLISGGVFFCIAWFTSSHGKTTGLSMDEQSKLNRMDSYLEDRLEIFDLEADYNAIDRDQIREYLMELAKTPHVAGLTRDEQLVDYIYSLWTDMGMDSVEKISYNVMLSRPSKDFDNVISLSSDDKGQDFFTTSNREDFDDLDENFVDAYLAFTPSGDEEEESRIFLLTVFRSTRSFKVNKAVI